MSLNMSCSSSCFSTPKLHLFSKLTVHRKRHTLHVTISNNGNNNNDNVNSYYTGNKYEALSVLSNMERPLSSLPSDLAGAIEKGKVPGSVVTRFLEMENDVLLGWLLQFNGFKERLLADDLFAAKLAMECALGIFTKSAAEYERRPGSFFNELEFVVADVIMAMIADFMLVYLPAPTVSLRPTLAISASPLAKFFHNCPDNAFQVPLSGTSYSFIQRTGAIVRNGAVLFAVGTSSSLIGTAVTNALIIGMNAVDKHSAADVEHLPILSTGVAYGVYMAISSNLRYQLLAGVVEQRILEPFLHRHKLMLSASCFAFRTGNTFLGSLLWVDFARWIGIQ